MVSELAGPELADVTPGSEVPGCPHWAHTKVKDSSLATNFFFSFAHGLGQITNLQGLSFYCMAWVGDSPRRTLGPRVDLLGRGRTAP